MPWRVQQRSVINDKAIEQFIVAPGAPLASAAFPDTCTKERDARYPSLGSYNGRKDRWQTLREALVKAAGIHCISEMATVLH